MSEPPIGHCRSCYRTVPGDAITCPSCEQQQAAGRGIARLALITGAVGLPLLVAGMLTLNVRLCVAGAVVAACGAIAYAVLMLRSG